MSVDPLLQPFQLRGLTLRNRLMSTAHEPAYTDDGMPKARYRLYHAEKARGGIALTMIGGSSVVAPDSPQAFGNILLYKDECVRWLKELADDVHDKGAAVMIQITHLGRRTSWSKDDWLPVIAPSHVREPAHRAFPKAMEDWDIARVIAAYADAAERVKAGGLDGVEFECYGHLIDQFWSPATNKRADEYGGSIDNRLRFGMAVFEAVRRRVGPDFLIGARLVCDEDWDRGLSRDEGMAIARRLTRSGLIDFLNVIKGHIDSDEALSRVIPGMGERSAPHLDFAGEVRAETRLPTFHAARIQDVATARHAIASGKLDMVGMTRAHMADPHIARKIAEGREAEIRPCVGMGYCIDSIYAGQAVCIHNPATGREATIPHLVPRSNGPKRKVVVVGAGPGGLEAARVAGERGHDVVVLEAAARPGGQIVLAAALKRRREIIGVVDWRVRECERLGVAFRFNAFAGADDVLGLDPDVVVIATGGAPNIEFLDFWRRIRGDQLGSPLGRRAAERRGDRLRRQRRSPGPQRRRIRRRFRGEARDRHPRAHARAGCRRHLLSALFPRLQPRRRQGVAEPEARIDRPPGKSRRRRLLRRIRPAAGGEGSGHDRRRARRGSGGRPLFRAQGGLDQPRRSRLRRAHRRAPTDREQQSRRPLSPVPDWRCGGEPQHPRRGL